jgi:RimJ/RimL family protein N-acetyltransferase
MPNSLRKPARAPLIETSRLKLRSHELADFDACVAMWSDPAVVRYIGGKPFPRAQSWARLLTYIGHWSMMGFGFWAVEERETGQFIGELGFAHFKRDIHPAMENIPEAGWAFTSSSHGKGYASEALNAVMSWGDSHLSVKKSVCIISPENKASLRIAEKLGYREFARETYLERPILLFDRVSDPVFEKPI